MRTLSRLAGAAALAALSGCGSAAVRDFHYVPNVRAADAPATSAPVVVATLEDRTTEPVVEKLSSVPPVAHYNMVKGGGGWFEIPILLPEVLSASLAEELENSGYFPSAAYEPGAEEKGEGVLVRGSVERALFSPLYSGGRSEMRVALKLEAVDRASGRALLSKTYTADEQRLLRASNDNAPWALDILRRLYGRFAAELAEAAK